MHPTVPPILKPILACLALAAAFMLGGCREFAQHRAELTTLHGIGNFEAAAATLDSPKGKSLYGSKNELLWNLDRGFVALATKDHDTAIALLEEAERTIEIQREKSAADVIGQWTINDTAAKYIAEPYEDMYVNIFKLLAQLEAGRLEGGATVEARRAASKADILRDQYITYASQIKKQGGRQLSSPAGPDRLSSGGKFVESPLGAYLTAITFLKTGDDQFHQVAARRLLDALRVQEGLIGSVREEDFQNIAELSPADVNTLVVALSGRGPTKYAERIGPIPIGTLPIYMELPRLRIHPSQVSGARVEVLTASGPSALGQAKLVEDLSRVAAANHEQMLPLIYARTFMRYALKAAASMVVTEAGRRRASDRDQSGVQIAGVLAGLVVLAATEEADLRSWIFLPGQARVSTFKLPPGRHQIRVAYQSHADGTLYTTNWQGVDVSPAGLATVITHFPR